MGNTTSSSSPYVSVRPDVYPFTAYGDIAQGQPLIVPSISQLVVLPPGQGYGCFSAPTKPIGVPLFHWTPTNNNNNNTANNNKLNSSDRSDASSSLSSSSSPTTNMDGSKLCSAGFWCPYLDPSNPDTVPVVCPPSEDCSIHRIFGALCLPQGRYEPIPCFSGFYCPNYKTISVCPKRHYCSRGSSEPRKCQFLSYCPEGSNYERHYGSLIIVALMDVIIAFLLFLHNRRESNIRMKPPKDSLLPLIVQALRQVRVRQNSAGNSSHNGSSPDDDDFFTTPAQEGLTEILVTSFEKSFGENGVPHLNFQFNNLDLALKSSPGKMILNKVSGKIQAGRMTAIIGPSGAGKTTFLNVLMGQAKRTGGQLLINGTVAEMSTFRKLIGYVPQDDVMLRELTVKETIAYSARIRLPSSWSNSDIEWHTNNVIEALGLTHVAHTIIGDEQARGVSGGERKRVNIGIELAACPLAIFLDEPTCGLDSTSALDVTQILRSVAQLGLTVVAIIHQPRVEIFECFDDVLMIVPGGRTAYLGPVDESQGYFEKLGFWFDPEINKADVIMDILSGRGKAADKSGRVSPLSMENIVEAWTKHCSAAASSNDTTADDGIELVDSPTTALTSPESERLQALLQTRGAPFFQQVWLAHHRSIVQQIRRIGSFWIEMLVGFASGLIIGVTSGSGEHVRGVLISPYIGLSAAAQFWLIAQCMAVGVTSASPGVKVFGEERFIFLREAAAGHNIAAYFVAKCVSVLYRIILTSWHFCAIYYFLATPNFSITMQYALLLLNFFCIYGLSAIISMLVRRENASLVAVIVSLFAGVFCGIGPTLHGYTTVLLALVPNRWAADTQFSLWVEGYTNIFDVDFGLDYYGYQMGNSVRNLTVMFGLGVFYRFIAFLIMVYLCGGKPHRRWLKFAF